MTGNKNDNGKLPWHLLPFPAVEKIIQVLQYGAGKYGENNWKHVKNQRHRYFSALCRHIFAWWKGEKTDPESGFSHLAHAGCCLLFLLDREK